MNSVFLKSRKRKREKQELDFAYTLICIEETKRKQRREELSSDFP